MEAEPQAKMCPGLSLSLQSFSLAPSMLRERGASEWSVVIWLAMVKSVQNSILVIALLAAAGCAKPSAYRADGLPKEMARVEDLDLVRDEHDGFDQDVSKLEEYDGEDLRDSGPEGAPAGSEENDTANSAANGSSPAQQRNGSNSRSETEGTGPQRRDPSVREIFPAPAERRQAPAFPAPVNGPSGNAQPRGQNQSQVFPQPRGQNQSQVFPQPRGQNQSQVFPQPRGQSQSQVFPQPASRSQRQIFPEPLASNPNAPVQTRAQNPSAAASAQASAEARRQVPTSPATTRSPQPNTQAPPPPAVTTAPRTAAPANAGASTSAQAPGWRNALGIAKWVILNEGDRVGKACNRFVQRVFERMGFGKGSWVANEFDSYAARTFGSYKVKTFSQATPQKDRENLREYLWSYPERTPFVFQWERSGPHGHIAFVERVKNELVIYHASLNRFKPKDQRVTIDTLLYKGGSQNKLMVYSHFQPKN